MKLKMKKKSTAQSKAKESVSTPSSIPSSIPSSTPSSSRGAATLRTDIPRPQERVKTTVQMANGIYLMGKGRARQMGQSFNAYLQMLIWQDCHAAHITHISGSTPQQSAPAIHVNLPAFMTPGAPPPLPHQRNPLDEYGDSYRAEIRNPETDRLENTILIPWRDIYRYDQYVTERSRNGRFNLNMAEVAKALKFPNIEYVMAAGMACDADQGAEFSRYMNARKLAIKRGFVPDDGIDMDEK